MSRLASTREQLIVAAEWLFSVHGFDGVTLQQIRAAAGLANRSAVRYHFGDKEGLVQAIFEFRLPGINRRRAALLDQLEDTGEISNVRGIVEALILPLAEEAEYGDSSYVSMLNQLGYYGWAREEYVRVNGDLTYPALRCLDLLRDALDLPEPIRGQRIWSTLVAWPAILANREHAVKLDTGNRRLPFSLFASDLVDWIMQALQAPVSDKTTKALRSLKEPQVAALASGYDPWAPGAARASSNHAASTVTGAPADKGARRPDRSSNAGASPRSLTERTK